MTQRAWLTITVAATLAVMGAMVAWGLRERSRPPSDEPRAKRPGASRRVGPVEPDRHFEMPEGCDVDPKHPPKIVFDLVGDQIDFGPMRQGQVLEKDVVLRNVGSGILCISNHHTGCGCVRVQYTGDKRIPATTTATLRVTVDVGFNRHGPQAKDVHLFTNDPARRTATFRVLADVRLGVMLVDSVVQFGRITKGKPATAVVKLKSPKDEEPWEVTSVEGAKTAYTFEAEEVADPEFRVVAVRLRHPGTDEMGPQPDTVKLRTSHPKHPEMLLHTNATVVDRYYAAPAAVPFGYMTKETQGSWFVVRLLASDPTGAVPFAGARVEGKGFEAGEAAPAGNGEWTVPVRPDTHGLPPGRASATLIVSLDDKELPEIRVPVHVDVLSREGRPPK